MEKVMVSEEDMQIVDFYLKESRQHGLDVEVISYALKYMKEDPNISIAEAITLGHSEWIK